MMFYHYIARKLLYNILIRVERYNMEQEEWEQIPPLNEAKCSTTATVINDKVYVFGGYIGDCNT